MSPKTFAVLAVATVIAAGAAIVSLGRDRGYQEVAGAGEVVIPGLLDRVNDVATVLIEHDEGKITIEKGEAGWTLKESDGYPARAVKVRRAILGLAQLRFREPKTRMKEKFAKLDLRDPDVEGARSRRVKLFDSGGAVLADLIVGRRRSILAGTTSGGVYVRRPGEIQTWLAAGTTDITDEKREWLERKILDVDSRRVRRAVIRHPGGETLVVSKESLESADFTVEDIPAGKKLISKAGPNTVGQALVSLLLDDASRDWGPFNPETTVTTEFATFDGLSLTTQVTKRDGKHWLKIAAAEGTDERPAEGAPTTAEEAREIMERTRGWVYQISEYAGSNLAKRPEHLLEDAKPKS